MAILVLMTPSPAKAIDANALPTAGSVVSGNATLDYASPNELHVRQDSNRAVINWDQFNIGTDALAEFHQPSSSALTVNRVIGNGDPAQILGRMKANGRVMVLDRNGVFFGPNSQVDVGGIIVSTGDVTNDSAMNDSALKIENIGPDGFIANNGTITVSEAGLAAFVSPMLVNNGVIQAKLGRIDMAAGSQATIDLYGDGLVELKLTAPMQQTLINNGVLHSDGGSVYMQAAAAKDVVDNLINNNGIIVADAIGKGEGGKVFLYAQGSNRSSATGGSVTINSGYISASGYSEGQKGGSVDILGDTVVLSGGSLIDISGDAGGGSIKVGGDYLGTGNTPTARFSYVDDDALILNDAITKGNGGRTIIWSDDTTDFHGTILARGGKESGDGGFVETSGKINLMADGYVDLTAPNGQKGQYLLDPNDITVYGNFAPNYVSTNNSLNLASLLTVWLDASTLTGLANGDSIATWGDLSGNNNHAVQPGGIKPTYVTNGLNGLGVVRFNGSQLMETLSSVGVSGNSSRYLSVLMNPASGASRNMAGYGVDGAGNIFDLMVYNSTIIGHFYGGGFDTLGGSPAATIGAWSNSSVLYDGSTVSIYTNGKFGNSKPLILNTTNSKLRIGGGGYAPFNYFQGDIAEVFLYSDDLDANARGLLDQYQAAKWGVAFLHSNPATEASMAMDTTNGYGSFTTRYLERISNTADIVLQASNSITLDFKGDTLNLANDRSINLTTSSGNISTLSAGTIRSNRTGTGGNITFNAGNDISLGHAFTLDAQNGGVINLNAAGNITAPAGLTVAHGDLTIDSQGITGIYSGKNAVLKSNAGTMSATVSFDSLDISGSAALLQGGYVGAPGPKDQSMANLIKVGGQPATANPAYTFAGHVIGYVPPAPSNAALDKISTVIQQSSGIAASNSASDNDDSMKEKVYLQADKKNIIASSNCLVIMDGGCIVQ